MKNNSLQGNNDLKNVFSGIFLFLSLAGWGYFLFLWTLLGYEWELFPLTISFSSWVLPFLKLPLFFKVCCGFIVFWWHIVLFQYKNKNRLFLIFLSLALALIFIAEQFLFILNPVRAYRNTLKLNLKAEVVSDS